MKPLNGFVMLAVVIALLVLSVVGFIFMGVNDGIWDSATMVTVGILSTVAIVLFCILVSGFKQLGPNEALVLTLFGKYHGTIKNPGFFYVNPFCQGVKPQPSMAFAVSQGIEAKTNKAQAQRDMANKKISTKIETLDNEKQKVNDKLGNPIEIGSVVIWQVVNPTKAVLCIDNYREYLSIQCDSTIRNIARLYPYDLVDDDPLNDDETTLRGSSQEIALKMQEALQKKVEDAGLEILEVRITNLAYAPEIAAAMLQRQQAVAIIAARQKIVEGAVSMVEMALSRLSENHVVELDEERKAAMVSNLLVVLCGNKDPQPVLNSGSLY